MSSKISVIPYNWNDHTCYIGKISYKDLTSLVDIRSDISMNRKIDDKRVDEIKRYILMDILATFFPPTILNSKANLSYESPGSLEVNSGTFTVIDGQHRIKAIITLLNEVQGVEKEQLKLMELPVVILEGLENYQHRDLFYMINETPKNVESNVSERFAPKLENLLGLNFFSENKHLVEAIEWHEKQSREKIVYIHMTDCIRELNRILYATLKDWYECERDLLYKESTYLSIINYYWNRYFENLDNVKNKSFFRKKITLRAVVEDIYLEIDKFNNIHLNPSTLEEYIDKILHIIEKSLDSLIQDPVIEYRGSENVNKNVFKSIRHFLILNNELIQYADQIRLSSNVQLLVNKVVNTYYTNNLLSLDKTDCLLFNKTIASIIRNKDLINKVEKEKLDEISIHKQTTIDEILEQFIVKG